MRAAISKAKIESEIASRFAAAFKVHDRLPVAVMSTGIREVDALTGGIPRGGITEIFGTASSGRTSFILSALAQATKQEEVCALVDTNNVFDPSSAAAAGIDFDRLLWIRCTDNLEHAFKATDLVLQGGGFGLVTLDLGSVPAKDARRIISSWWYRFRRVLENTPTALIVLTQEACVRSCAALALQMKREADVWSSVNSEFHPRDTRELQSMNTSITKRYGPSLLESLHLNITKQKPISLRQSEVWVYAYTPDCTKIQVSTLDSRQRLSG